MDLIAPVFLQLAITSPLLLLWLVGIVLAVLRFREPRFRLVLIALLLFLVLNVAGTIINLVLPINLQRRFMSAVEIGGVLSAVGIVRVLLEGVGWVLLLLALFKRAPEERVLSRQA
ncbi:hypothetical protein [Deinococcus altitudinis]|uniref:hypothetical protein n=1 Tax=Deinococcus altitudinis TaxID=468914 RepID=UPI003891F07C